MQTYTAETDGFMSLKNIPWENRQFSGGTVGGCKEVPAGTRHIPAGKSASHGTIYATAHYLENLPVYCLEHTLSGLGEGSGTNKTETGPYALLDMEAFVNSAEGGGVNGVRCRGAEPCTPSAGCFGTPTRLWCWIAAMQTTKCAEPCRGSVCHPRGD